MAYVHCHKCDWSQDDFYSKDDYNPAKYLMDWNDQLLGEDIDKPFTTDSGFIRENGNISTREVVAREYEKFARRIRTMRWITWEAWKAEINKICPKCGSSYLDID